MHKRKITVGREWIGREDRSRAGKIVCKHLLLCRSGSEGSTHGNSVRTEKKSYQKSSDGYLHVFIEHSSVDWVDGSAVESFATWSAISFPGIFWWPGTQRKRTS